MISQAYIKEHLYYDPTTGTFEWLIPKDGRQKHAGSKTPNYYTRICINGRSYKAHRLAWIYMHGDVLDAESYIDHINTDKADNRIDNLRIATKAQNMRNCGRRADNTSGYKNVSWSIDKQKWRSWVSTQEKRYRHLGYFNTPQEAYAVWLIEAPKYHGEFFNPGEKK